jgi:cytochrome P450
MLQRFAEAAGPVGSIRFGTRNIVLVNTPNLVHEVLVTQADTFHKGPALSIYSRPLLGNGLLTSEDDFHRRQRGLVAPAFAHRRVAGYAKGMAHAAERLQANWKDGETLDVAHEMTRLTLGIVGKTLFDADLLGEADDVGRALTITMRYLVDVIRSPLRLPFAWIPPWKRDVKAALVRLDATIYGLIEARRASGQDTGDLLSMLLLARDEENGGTAMMDPKQVRDEAMTLFLAGHETTANALAWTWYLLARHPEIYARVQAETDAALAGRSPTFDDLARLPYTLQVLKEAMRLYPPAYAIVRQAMQDVVIGGFRVPRGAIVLLSPYLLHHDPALFSDPETFDPGRFSPDAESARPRHAYLPFGGGPRVCIGAAFALMEGQLVLATLAQRVTFRLAEPNRRIKPEPLITLRPRGGVPVVVTRRRGA